MPNAKDFKPGSENILVAGMPGSGKTTLFGTVPGKKFAYLFDPNALNSLQGMDVDYELFKPDILPLDAIPLKAGAAGPSYHKPPEPTTYIDWEQHFEKNLSEGFFDQYNAVMIDGCSTLTDIIMDRIQWLNNRFGKHPEMADNTAVMGTFLNIMRTFTAMPQVCYLTAHIEYRQDASGSGPMINQMSLLGRLRNRIPSLFSDIWLAFADHDEKGQHYILQTESDRVNPYLRSSRNMNFEEEVTISDFSTPEKFGVGALFSAPDRGRKEEAA